MKKSLQTRLLYSMVGVVILALIGVSFGVSFLIKGYIYNSKQKELIAKGFELVNIVNSYNQGEINNNQLTSFLNSIDSFLNARVWVLDSSHKIIAISTPRRGMGMGRGMRNDAGKGRNLLGLRHTEVNNFEEAYNGNVVTKTLHHPVYDENMLVVAIPVKQSDGSVQGVIVLHTLISELNTFLNMIYYYIAAAGFLAVLLTIVFALWISRGIVRPLKAMQKTASAMAAGDYNTRVDVTSDDEVGQLGNSLNELAQDLGIFVDKTERMEKMRRDFVANVSHELRTPLTIIRGYNEALSDGTVISDDMKQKYHGLIREETMRLERLIKDLLDLSRLQTAAKPLEMEFIPINALVKSVTAVLRKKVEDKEILLNTTLTVVPDIWGNGDRLTQLIFILLDNSIKYTPPKGVININTFVDNDMVILELSDTGIGIPQDDLPYIWERFYKVDKSHAKSDEGTGLGLAIAKEIIELHGARVLVSSVIGQGTSFKILFFKK